jgi:phage shock protein C
MLNLILNFFEQQAYGVCFWLGERMGIRPRRIRLSFIYLSFLTFGSPIFIYLVLKFWRDNSWIFNPLKWRRGVMEW